MVAAILEAKSWIKLLSGKVVASDFQVDGMDSLCAGSVLDELHGFASPTLTTMAFEEKKFIDEGIAAEEFEAVAEGEHDVANDSFFRKDKPDQAIRRFS